MTEIRILSVRQPWASLIVSGLPATPPIFKDVENRSRSTPYRGLVAIHASKTHDNEAGLRTLNWLSFHGSGVAVRLAAAKMLARSDPWMEMLPRGAIIGIVNLYDVTGVAESDWAADGMFHYRLKEPVALDVPYHAKGQLGLIRMHGPFAEALIELHTKRYP